MYIGATAAEVLEAREWVIAFQAKVPMTPEEKAASDGDIERLNAILAQKRDIPPPTPPNADYHFVQEQEQNELPPPLTSDQETERETLQRTVNALRQDWEQAQQRYGKRHAVSRSLKQHLLQLEHQLAEIPVDDHSSLDR